MKAFIILGCLAATYVAVNAHVIPAPVIAVGEVPVSTSKVVQAPANPSTSQFHKQDEFGNLAFGYANINSARQESGNTFIGRTGSYSYVDSNGILRTVYYIADGLGFRIVAASNLPVAPVAEHVELVAPVFSLVGPAPVEDTPEVAAAKAEHLAKLAAAS